MEPEIVKKNLITICLAVGMMIFGGVLLYKVDVWADQQRAMVAQQSAEDGWTVFLYQQTARDVLERRKKSE